MSLPRDADGVITNAEFGVHYAVEIEYNTDFDGRQIDPGKEEYPRTLHGPFDSEEEAVEWMDSYPDGDTDLHDMRVITQNRVRPAEETRGCSCGMADYGTAGHDGAVGA